MIRLRLVQRLLVTRLPQNVQAGRRLDKRELWIVPIPATTKLHRLDRNLGATAVEWTPDDVREIDSAASKIRVRGARYPEHLERMTGR